VLYPHGAGWFSWWIERLARRSVLDMPSHLHLAEASEEDATTGAGAAIIRVVLADDHKLMRSSLRALLEREEGIRVVAEAGDLAEAIHQVEGSNPNVLVLDLGMPDGSSFETIWRLQERAPETQVVVVTAQDDPAFARRALTAGALGFVVKDSADRELPRALRAVVRGEQFVSPGVGSRLGAVDRGLTQHRLTPREVEVLRLIALGHTSVEMGRQLGLSPRTVETHRAHIHKKLGLSTRAELVRYALRHGLLAA